MHEKSPSMEKWDVGGLTWSNCRDVKQHTQWRAKETCHYQVMTIRHLWREVGLANKAEEVQGPSPWHSHLGTQAYTGSFPCKQHNCVSFQVCVYLENLQIQKSQPHCFQDYSFPFCLLAPYQGDSSFFAFICQGRPPEQMISTCSRFNMWKVYFLLMSPFFLCELVWRQEGEMDFVPQSHKCNLDGSLCTIPLLRVFSI